MNPGRLTLTILICICALTFTERIVKQAIGAQKANKEQASSAVAVKTVRPSSEPTQRFGSNIPSSTEMQRPSKTVQKSSSREEPLTDLKRIASKGGLQAKVRKKILPKAVVQPKAAVQPRTDLMYYGILEDSQRYDPRPNPHNAGVPNPQTPDLAHDHFQELDHNMDGRIDPVERAFGRIDMDRDLSNRQFR